MTCPTAHCYTKSACPYPPAPPTCSRQPSTQSWLRSAVSPGARAQACVVNARLAGSPHRRISWKPLWQRCATAVLHIRTIAASPSFGRRSPPSCCVTMACTMILSPKSWSPQGATFGIYTALTALINDGDEVLLPDPIYDAYQSPIRLAGGRPSRVLSRIAGRGSN